MKNYASTSGNLNEMDKVLENINLLTYPKRNKRIEINGPIFIKEIESTIKTFN